jgi:hypothetical protein
MSLDMFYLISSISYFAIKKLQAIGILLQLSIILHDSKGLVLN